MMSETQRSLCYNLKEGAKAAGVSPPTMRALVHSAGFPALRVGRRILIPIAGLERWLEEQASQGLHVNLKAGNIKASCGR